MRVEKVLFDGAEELALDGEVFVIVVGFCFAAGGFKLVETGVRACSKHTLCLGSVTGLGP